MSNALARSAALLKFMSSNYVYVGRRYLIAPREHTFVTVTVLFGGAQTTTTVDLNHGSVD